MAEFRMPSLGADMEAGTLLEWCVKPGDTVRRGDVVAVVDTQKGAIDVEIFQSGVVEALLVEPGRKVPVGAVLARLRGDGEPATPAPVPTPGPEGVPAPVSRPAPPAGPAAAPGARQRVSPRARRRAAERGLDLAAVRGTGPGGAVTAADVEEAAPAAASPADRQAAMRRAIAAAMSRSKREIPHYYLETAIDVGRALEWLEAENARRDVTERLLPVVLLLKAAAVALARVPGLNGFWEAGGFRPGDGVHLGTAVALRGGGLVAPALHDADSRSVTSLMQDLRDLVLRARSGSLRSSELSDATATVTSLGDVAVDRVYGVIYPPQVAMMGFGRMMQQPRVVGGLIQARPVVHATLAADHRASDGHQGARLLETVDRLLQEPEKL